MSVGSAPVNGTPSYDTHHATCAWQCGRPFCISIEACITLTEARHVGRRGADRGDEDSGVQVFANPAALDCLASAVLAELHDEWQASERRYFSEASMAELFKGKTTDPAPTQITSQPEPNHPTK